METINYIQRNQLSIEHLREEISGLVFQSRYAVFFKITELNAPAEDRNQKKTDRIHFEDVLTGLYEANIPIAFSLANKDNRISVKIGTWADSENNLISKSSVLEALIGSSNEYIKFEKCSYAPIPIIDIANDNLAEKVNKNPHEGMLKTIVEVVANYDKPSFWSKNTVKILNWLGGNGLKGPDEQHKEMIESVNRSIDNMSKKIDDKIAENNKRLQELKEQLGKLNKNK